MAKPYIPRAIFGIALLTTFFISCSGNRGNSPLPASLPPANAHAGEQLQAFTPYVNESFLGSTLANASNWLVLSSNPTHSGCLTAGNSVSIPACSSGDGGGNSGFLPDNPGQGALRLTQNVPGQAASVIYMPTLPSSAGFQAVYTLASYGKPAPSDGSAFVILDGDKPLPTSDLFKGGNLGCLGLASAYLCVAFDEWGGFSNPNYTFYGSNGKINGLTVKGGPGQIPNTIALRGSSASSWAYISGYNVNGIAAPLPFPLGQSATLQRQNLPLHQVRVTLTPGSMLSVEINSGNGYQMYIPPVSIASGAALPANLRIGVSAANGGGGRSYHEIQNLSLTSTLPAPTPVPVASVVPIPLPVPTAKPIDLSAWNDPSVWSKQDNHTVGGSWDVGFRSDHNIISGSALDITLDNGLCPTGCSGKGYATGEMNTTAKYQYGLYEVDMKTAAGSGLLSSIFTYIDVTEGLPLPEKNDEIDIEIKGQTPTLMQTTVYTQGVEEITHIVDLGFDSSQAMHHYGINWTPQVIQWLVDGKLLWSVNASAYPLPSTPSNLYVLLWTAGNPGSWFGPYTYNGPAHALYQNPRFTPYTGA